MPALFDTLALANELEKSGFSAAQAKGVSKALSGAMSEQVATKSDIRGIEIKLDSIEAQLSMIKWMCGVTIAGVAALVVKSFF